MRVLQYWLRRVPARIAEARLLACTERSRRSVFQSEGFADSALVLSVHCLRFATLICVRGQGIRPKANALNVLGLN
mgnify:FL=1